MQDPETHPEDVDPVEADEQALARLRERIRVETERLDGLRATLARLDADPQGGRRPFVGPAFVVGLFLGMPVWFLFMLAMRW
jgi:hypothetical protein